MKHIKFQFFILSLALLGLNFNAFASEFMSLRSDGDYVVGIEIDPNTNQQSVILLDGSQGKQKPTTLASVNMVDVSLFSEGTTYYVEEPCDTRLPIISEQLHNPDVNTQAGYATYIKKITTVECEENFYPTEEDDPYDYNGDGFTQNNTITHKDILEIHTYDLNRNATRRITPNNLYVGTVNFSAPNSDFENYAFRITSDRICFSGKINTTSSIGRELTCYDIAQNQLRELTQNQSIHELALYDELITANIYSRNTNPFLSLHFDITDIYSPNNVFPTANAQATTQSISFSRRGLVEMDCKQNALSELDDLGEDETLAFNCASIYHEMIRSNGNQPLGILYSFDHANNSESVISTGSWGYSDVKFLKRNYFTSKPMLTNGFKVIYIEDGQAQDGSSGIKNQIRIYNSISGVSRTLYQAPTSAHTIHSVKFLNDKVVFILEDANQINSDKIYTFDLNTSQLQILSS